MNELIYNNNTEWFKKVYNSLVENAKARGLKKKKLNYYTEKHHITPRCMGGKDESENYVLLTYREHVVAHELLARIYDDIVELKHVVYLMYNSSKKHNVEIRMTSRQLEVLRIASAKYLSNKLKGREIKLEWIEKAKKTKAERGLSDYARKMQALGRVGMVFSEERKRKIGNSMKGRTLSEDSLDKRKDSVGVKIQGPNGTFYRSVLECSRELNISSRQVYNLLNNPNSGYKKVERLGYKRKVIDPEGNIFSSIRSCAIYHNRDGKCIKNWIENYPDRGFKYYDET